MATARKTGKVLDASEAADVRKVLKEADKVDDATEIGEKALKNLDDYNDATKGLVKNSDEIADTTKVAKKTSKASSKTLARNLEKSGFKRPDNYKSAAHHIVAGNDKRAAKSREILESFEININDASNGVFLPTGKGVSKAIYHPALNTDRYNKNVYEMLVRAQSREEAIVVLEKIRDMLLNGTFGY